MITVQLFARYKERLGWSREAFPLPDPPTLAALLAAPPLDQLPADALYAVNQAFAGRETRLEDGDEVAAMPPVSGG